MIISHSRRFVFVHIHKAGGTSVEKALDPHLAWNDLILGGSAFGEKIQAPYRARWRLDKHSTLNEIETVCGAQFLDDCFVFGLVREPLSRACSVYNFVASTVHRWAERQNIAMEDVAKMITPRAAKKTPGLAWTSTRIFLKTKDFSEFIRHADIGQVAGFRLQSAALARIPQGPPAAKIFRLEDYPAWSAELGRRLDLDFELPHANQSGLRLADPKSISAEDRDLVRQMFRADYETFGYE